MQILALTTAALVAVMIAVVVAHPRTVNRTLVTVFLVVAVAVVVLVKAAAVVTARRVSNIYGKLKRQCFDCTIYSLFTL